MKRKRATKKQIEERLNKLKQWLLTFKSGVLFKPSKDCVSDINKFYASIVYNSKDTFDDDIKRLEKQNYVRVVRGKRKTFANITKKQRCQYTFKEDRKMFFIPKGIDIEQQYNLTQYYKYKYKKTDKGVYSINAPSGQYISTVGKYKVLDEIKYWTKMFNKIYPNVGAQYGLQLMS